MPREGIIRQMSWLFLRTRLVMPLHVLIVFETLHPLGQIRSNQRLFCCCCFVVVNHKTYFTVKSDVLLLGTAAVLCNIPILMGPIKTQTAEARLQLFGSLLDSLQIFIQFPGASCQVLLFKLPKRHLFGQESVC